MSNFLYQNSNPQALRKVLATRLSGRCENDHFYKYNTALYKIFIKEPLGHLTVKITLVRICSRSRLFMRVRQLRGDVSLTRYVPKKVFFLATPLGSTSPILYEQWGGFFYVPHEQISQSAV